MTPQKPTFQELRSNFFNNLSQILVLFFLLLLVLGCNKKENSEIRDKRFLIADSLVMDLTNNEFSRKLDTVLANIIKKETRQKDVKCNSYQIVSQLNFDKDLDNEIILNIQYANKYANFNNLFLIIKKDRNYWESLGIIEYDFRQGGFPEIDTLKQIITIKGKFCLSSDMVYCRFVKTFFKVTNNKITNILQTIDYESSSAIGYRFSDKVRNNNNISFVEISNRKKLIKNI
jgi:hypothetical protein